jgi:hypothetical protein
VPVAEEKKKTLEQHYRKGDRKEARAVSRFDVLFLSAPFAEILQSDDSSAA